MTIGATSTFSQTADEICSDALAKLGVIAPGKDASSARTSAQNLHARRALNRLVKSMDAEGEFLWRIVRRTATLAASDSSFDLLPDVLDIDEPMRVTKSGDSSSTTMTAMSRDEYMSLAERLDEGTPQRYFFERALSGGTTVQIHPANDTANTVIEYAAFVRAADYTSGADTSDFLQKWERCLVWGLAAELAPEYGQTSKVQAFTDMHESLKAKLLGDDTERGKLVLVPFGGGCW